MRSIPVLIGSVLLITTPGFSELLTTAEDYAVDSDVVLESAIKEIKSAPRDTINVMGDVIKFAKDETQTAVKGIVAPFKKDIHAGAQNAGELAIANAWNSSDDLLFRSYKVNSKLGDLLMAGSEDKAVPSIDVSEFFKGIQFPKNAAAQYLPEFQCVFVRQTMAGLLGIERMLSEYRSEQKDLMGHQVEIETKFIEVSQNTLNELGFSWRFGGKGAGGTGDLNIMDNLVLPAGQNIFSTGLRTSAGALNSGVNPAVVQVAKTAGSLRWEMYISALEQAKDTDVLCAPRVVTRDGTAAIIQVGDEQMLPKAFEINSSDTSPFIAHTDWDLEMMGVIMEVTPNIRKEGQIDLDLHPKVIEIVGYDTYTASEQYAITGTIMPPLTASLPYCRVREMETRVTVADGSTVAMGGLIYDKLETFRDKVPVLGSIPLLGRLFRSEGEKSVKRNLMIFVTATQVDVDGRRATDLALKK
jgi:hypothetical protein